MRVTSRHTLSPAAVGVTHDHLATGAGVAFDGVGEALHRLVDGGLVEILTRPGDGRQDDIRDLVHRTECLLDQRRVCCGGLAVCGKGSSSVAAAVVDTSPAAVVVGSAAAVVAGSSSGAAVVLVSATSPVQAARTMPTRRSGR